MTRTYDDLQNFYKQNSPRDINKRDFSNSSPLAKLYIILGSVLSVMMFFLGIRLVNNLMSMQAESKEINLVSLLVFASVFIAVALMVISGLLSYRNSRNLLRYGILSKGTILSVKALPARLNAKSFYKIKIKIIEGTSKSTLADFVDNYALDYFLDARDNETPVDVLVLPGITKGLLLYKLHTSKRLD